MKSTKEKRLIKEVPSDNLSFRKIHKKERVLLIVAELNRIYHSELLTWDCAKRTFLTCALI